jgi:hypothetical protein
MAAGTAPRLLGGAAWAGRQAGPPRWPGGRCHAAALQRLGRCAPHLAAGVPQRPPRRCARPAAQIVGRYHTHPGYNALPSRAEVLAQMLAQQEHQEEWEDEPYVAALVAPETMVAGGGGRRGHSEVAWYHVDRELLRGRSKLVREGRDPLEQGCRCGVRGCWGGLAARGGGQAGGWGAAWRGARWAACRGAVERAGPAVLRLGRAPGGERVCSCAAPRAPR